MINIWPQMEWDSSMETLRMLMDSFDASCGPQLTSQKVVSDGVVDGEVRSSSDNGKCMKDSNVEFGILNLTP